MTPRFFCAALALALVAVACATKWETVSGAGFTVEMPGQPEKQTKTINTSAGPVTINKIIVETGDEAFIVSYHDYPAASTDPINPDQMFNNARDGAIKSVNGKLTSERPLALDNVPGKEFIGDATTPTETTFTARIYWQKPRLYQVLYAHNKSISASDKGEKFLNSFRLTGGQ